MSSANQAQTESGNRPNIETPTPMRGTEDTKRRRPADQSAGGNPRRGAKHPPIRRQGQNPDTAVIKGASAQRVAGGQVRSQTSPNVHPTDGSAGSIAV